jgi:hypothetical protein
LKTARSEFVPLVLLATCLSALVCGLGRRPK